MNSYFIIKELQLCYNEAIFILFSEYMKYKGSDNALVELVSIQVDFHCGYDLERYPFDSQQCSLEFMVTFCFYSLDETQ